MLTDGHRPEGRQRVIIQGGTYPTTEINHLKPGTFALEPQMVSGDRRIGQNQFILGVAADAQAGADQDRGVSQFRACNLFEDEVIQRSPSGQRKRGVTADAP